MTDHFTLDGAWTDGEITVRYGESIVFEGSVTGVSLEGISLTFHAHSGGVWRYERGTIPGYADPSVQTLIVKHVEQALIDAGFSVAPKAASPEYGSEDTTPEQ